MLKPSNLIIKKTWNLNEIYEKNNLNRNLNLNETAAKKKKDYLIFIKGEACLNK